MSRLFKVFAGVNTHFFCVEFVECLLTVFNSCLKVLLYHLVIYLYITFVFVQYCLFILHYSGLFSCFIRSFSYFPVQYTPFWFSTAVSFLIILGYVLVSLDHFSVSHYFLQVIILLEKTQKFDFISSYTYVVLYSVHTVLFQFHFVLRSHISFIFCSCLSCLSFSFSVLFCALLFLCQFHFVLHSRFCFILCFVISAVSSILCSIPASVYFRPVFPFPGQIILYQKIINPRSITMYTDTSNN